MRSVQGHMAAVAEMMERDAPCDEVVRQLHAVRGALRAINRELWRAYLFDPHCGMHDKDKHKRVRAWRTLRALMNRKHQAKLHHTRTAFS